MPYIVRQGDYLAKLAFVKGFDADEVWNDPKNEDLRKLRPDPNILAPGDILYVPDTPAQSLPIQKGTENNYSATVPRSTLTLVFKDAPLWGADYVIIGLGDDVSGTTDGSGKLTVEVPVIVREFGVRFDAQAVVCSVRVGDLDPVEETSGWRQRLVQLGYRASPDGEPDDVLAAADGDAIAFFQASSGLAATGVMDAGTQAALKVAHRS